MCLGGAGLSEDSSREDFETAWKGCEEGASDESATAILSAYDECFGGSLMLK